MLLLKISLGIKPLKFVLLEISKIFSLINIYFTISDDNNFMLKLENKKFLVKSRNLKPNMCIILYLLFFLLVCL